MKIPAILDGELVYVVAFDTRNPADAVCVRQDGSFARAELKDLRVVPGKFKPATPKSSEGPA